MITIFYNLILPFNFWFYVEKPTRVLQNPKLNQKKEIKKREIQVIST